jgi:hypothetical protein
MRYARVLGMSGTGADDCVALPPHPGGFDESDLGLGLGVVLADELSRLGPTVHPGFLKDRRDLGV